MDGPEIEFRAKQRPQTELSDVSQHVGDGRLRRVEAQLLVSGRGTLQVDVKSLQLLPLCVLKKKPDDLS